MRVETEAEPQESVVPNPVADVAFAPIAPHMPIQEPVDRWLTSTAGSRERAVNSRERGDLDQVVAAVVRNELGQRERTLRGASHRTHQSVQ